MVGETATRVLDLINELSHGNFIDKMTKQWLAQTPTMPQILIFYTLTRIQKPTPVGCDIKCHLRVHINNVSGQAEIMHLGKRKFVTSANNPEIRGKKPRTRRKQ